MEQTIAQFQSLFLMLQKRNIFFSLEEGILCDLSIGIMKITKKEPKEFMSQRFIDLLPWTERSIIHYTEQVDRIIRKDIECAEFEMDFSNNEDTLSTLHITVYPKYDREENIIGINGIAEDITYKKEIEEENRNLQNIIDEFTVYVKTDLSGMIVDASDGFYSEFRASRDMLKGKNINVLQSGNTSREENQKLWKTIQSGNVFEHEIQNYTLDMEKHWYHVKIVPQLNNNKEITGYMAFYHNIDEKIKFKREAHTDPLTQLMNRQYFQDISSKINYKDYDVMMIDLDHFKGVNDTFGHQTGDKVLKKIATILRSITRNDDILIRYGGEEFLLLLYNPASDLMVTKKISERIRSTIENEKIDYQEMEINPTVSIGINAHTERCSHLDEAILHADEMLYVAKRRGRNCIEVYNQSNFEENGYRKNKYTITEIKDALDNDRLICLYQPIVNAEKQIIKYESLVRLIDKHGNPLMPNTFFPLIKNTNIYVNMTKMVIKYNFDFFRTKNEHFALNLSFSDLFNKSIVNIIIKKVDENPEIAKRLTIELLEKELIDDLAEIEKIMTLFREKGINFAIDDFGSGYPINCNILKLKFDYNLPVISSEKINNIWELIEKKHIIGAVKNSKSIEEQLNDKYGSAWKAGTSDFASKSPKAGAETA